MAKINLQCNNPLQTHLSVLTGRAYLGEVLSQVWLKSIKKRMSNCTNK